MDENAVFVLSNGAPKRVVVTTGLTDGKFTAVTGGDLKAGDLVITSMEQQGSGAGGGGSRGGFGGPRF
jgi:HlyD family secretion protein